MERFKRTRVGVALILATVLAGCGSSGGGSCAASALLGGLSTCTGGGGDTSSPAQSPAQSVIQGVYQGMSSNGATNDVIVLEDGSFWDIYGVPVGSALAVSGIAAGTSSASNGTFSIVYTDFLGPGASPVSGQGSGTYSASSLTGSYTTGGTTATFNLVAPVQVAYDYNAAANVDSIAGTWTGGLLTGETATITILSDGTLSGTSSLGCKFSGSVAPRSSGKNVFDLSVTFGASPCIAANQSATGIGLTYPLGSGLSQLAAGLVSSSKSFATGFFAQR